MKSTNVTVAEVMAVTGLGRNQVYRLAGKGCIPASVIGRKFVMTRAQLDQLQREGVKPEPIEEKPKKESKKPRDIRNSPLLQSRKAS